MGWKSFLSWLGFGEAKDLEIEEETESELNEIREALENYRKARLRFTIEKRTKLKSPTGSFTVLVAGAKENINNSEKHAKSLQTVTERIKEKLREQRPEKRPHFYTEEEKEIFEITSSLVGSLAPIKDNAKRLVRSDIEEALSNSKLARALFNKLEDQISILEELEGYIQKLLVLEKKVERKDNLKKAS